MPRFSPFRPTRSIEINRGVEDPPRNVCAIGLAYLALTLKRLTQPVVAFKMIWDGRIGTRPGHFSASRRRLT